MNCERAFELLTGDLEGRDVRGGGDESPASLASHLVDCPRCARLAAQFAPARELFGEAKHEQPCAEMRAVTGPWCVAEPGAQVLAQRRNTVAAEPALSPWMSLAAALLVGLVLGGLNNGQRNGNANATAAHMPARLLGTQMLGSLELTPACLPESGGRRPTGNSLRVRPALELLAQLDVGELACCTVCHAPGSAAADIRQAMQHVARSCSVCHTN